VPERELCVHGSPGSGKTYLAIRLATAAALQFGPQSVGCVSFTRAAAQEFRARIATALSLSPERALKEVPYCGTTHALAWRMIGRPPVVADNGRAFAKDLNIPQEKWRDISTDRYLPSPDEVDALSPGEPSPDMSAVRLALAVWEGLRHRYPYSPPLNHLSELLPHTLPAGESYDSILDLIQRYETWKKEKHVYDFSDLLIEGRRHTLPVRILLQDEAQDSSPLIWSVVDAWAKNVHTLASFGDPFQALYLFSGGDPRLFRDRTGRWLHMKEAHRFSNVHAEYAKEILRAGGWNSPEDRAFHDSWGGVGDSPPDGTTFYLARTHSLLIPFRERFLSEGTPFGELRGKGPLQSKAAASWLIAQKWARGEPLFATELLAFAESLPAHSLKHGTLPALRKLADLPGLQMQGDEVRQRLGNYTPTYLADRLEFSDYYRKVSEVHGEGAFKEKPKILLSTVHGAKGRQASVVHLVRSWGNLPARNMRRNPQEEALVAYVGVSRHQKELILEDSESGIDYDFP
jgi:superfamily I DNA/RNA helicase